MKIRTDFVTNSSSSSFSVLVKITDKKGKNYTFQEDPFEYNPSFGGRCFFNKDLDLLLMKSAIGRIKENQNEMFKLKEVESNGRNTRIEHVRVGQTVKLVKIPGQTSIKSGSVDYAVDVRSEEGSIGILPSSAVDLIRDYFDISTITLKTIVSSVKPLSAMRSNAKFAQISVSFDAVANNPGQALTVKNVSELADYLMGAVSDDLDSREEDDLEEEDKAFLKIIAERKSQFVADISKCIPTIKDISKITVSRKYRAWGEDVDLLAENDYELCDLAQEVQSASGAEKKKALNKMLNYIRSATLHPVGMHFGNGMSVTYFWNGTEKDLIALANRLCREECAEFCEGIERREIDLDRETVSSRAIFSLDADGRAKGLPDGF